jgi:hypothetical protein
MSQEVEKLNDYIDAAHQKWSRLLVAKDAVIEAACEQKRLSKIFNQAETAHWEAGAWDMTRLQLAVESAYAAWIKSTKAIDAAIEALEKLEAGEK